MIDRVNGITKSKCKENASGFPIEFIHMVGVKAKKDNISCIHFIHFYAFIF